MADLIRTWKLDPVTGDLALTDAGRPATVSGAEGFLQAVETALAGIVGDWFLDEDDGIDYFGVVFIKSPNLLRVRAALVTRIQGVYGCRQVTGLYFSYDNEKRKLIANWAADTDAGAVAGTSLLTASNGNG